MNRNRWTAATITAPLVVTRLAPEQPMPFVVAVPPQSPVDVPRPSPPPLPSTVIGRKLEQDSWKGYLVGGDRTFIVTAGAVMADSCRVEEVLPTPMILTYLPLGEKQTLQTEATLND